MNTNKETAMVQLPQSTLQGVLSFVLACDHLPPGCNIEHVIAMVNGLMQARPVDIVSTDSEKDDKD